MKVTARTIEMWLMAHMKPCNIPISRIDLYQGNRVEEFFNRRCVLQNGRSYLGVGGHCVKIRLDHCYGLSFVANRRETRLLVGKFHIFQAHHFRCLIWTLVQSTCDPACLSPQKQMLRIRRLASCTTVTTRHINNRFQQQR